MVLLRGCQHELVNINFVTIEYSTILQTVFKSRTFIFPNLLIFGAFMQKSKLVILLKALNAEEFRQFYRYLKSPFFTKSKEVIQFYDYIRRFYPDFTDSKLDRIAIFTALYPKEKFNGPRIRNLVLKITKILEEYLIYLEYQQNDFQKKKLLTHIYGKRNVNVIFKQKTEELLADLENQPFRDADYFYHKYTLERDYYLFFHNHKDEKDLFPIKQAIKELKNFQELEQLKLSLYIRNRENIYAASSKEKSRISDQNKSVAILYKEVLQLFEDNTNNNFVRVKHLFLAQKAKLRKADTQNILVILINQALKKVNVEADVYMNEVFSLYRLGIDEEILTENNTLHGFIYLNVVIYGAALGEYQWLDTFMPKYSPAISGSYTNDILVLSKAYYHFHKANFSQATNLISAHKFLNKRMEILAKTLSIRAFYELYHQDETLHGFLQNALDAFYKFLKRDFVLNNEKILTYLNFIKLLKRLVKVKHKNSTNAQKNNLISFLEANKPMIAVAWLRQKIEAI